MSVRTVSDVLVPATPVENVRCYDLYVDGHIHGPSGEGGTFLIGLTGLTGGYANDSYSVSIPDSSYSKFGYMVNLQLKQLTHTIVSSGGVFTISTLPTYLRPATLQRYFFVGINNGTEGVCTLEIATTGVITLYSGANPTSFSAGLGGIPRATSITYTIN